ncbi:twin transmembrane helix small protein [Candidatus Raskinella chloraquaticus]|uniref:HIG1 domain-containing protein n=1 Tax=Candidatus Raskinella chloraquaticus TaxID=1951219 RepID=A0A1W9HSD4_9HYPH|nr:MAG: hypothetical protein A4S15_00640 [Proteobacteria bacterium SG_bin8]
MDTIVKILSFLAVLAVVVVLVRGLWNMAKGGSANTSQRLMRMRVMLQFVAVMVLMALLWLSGR